MKLYYPFYYLFYRFYKFNEYLFGNKYQDEVGNIPLIGGVLTCQLINIFSFLFLLSEKYDFRSKIDKKYFFTGVILLVCFNFFIFLWKGRDKQILKMFENETPQQKKLGVVLTWIYVIVSFGLFFYAI